MKRGLSSLCLRLHFSSFHTHTHTYINLSSPCSWFLLLGLALPGLHYWKRFGHLSPKLFSHRHKVTFPSHISKWLFRKMPASSDLFPRMSSVSWQNVACAEFFYAQCALSQSRHEHFFWAFGMANVAIKPMICSGQSGFIWRNVPAALDKQ